MRSTNVRWASVALTATLALSACNGDDDPAAAGTTVGGAAAGTVTISGSSTVAPISSVVADDLNESGSPAEITVDDPGTGDGFALFCEGDIDIADASRPIKDEEAQACADAGVEFVELEVAFDGITVLTNPANAAVDCLTPADLYALVSSETQGFTTWSDGQAIAAGLGSGTDLPDVPLAVTAPGTESGTYDAFIELALEGPAEERGVEAGVRSDYTSQADDNAIIAGIESSDTGLGWVGFAFAEGAGEAVKPVAIDDGDGCVVPSLATIADGSYPLSRSLFIYVNVATAAANQAVADYVDFYVSEDALTGLVEEAGYVPLPAERAEATRERWQSRTTGTAVGG